MMLVRVHCRMQAFDFPHYGEREALKSVLSEFCCVGEKNVDHTFDEDNTDAGCFFLVIRVTAQPELHLITKLRFCDLFGLEQHQVINVHWSNDSTGSSPLCFRVNAYTNTVVIRAAIRV